MRMRLQRIPQRIAGSGSSTPYGVVRRHEETLSASVAHQFQGGDLLMPNPTLVGSHDKRGSFFKMRKEQGRTGGRKQYVEALEGGKHASQDANPMQEVMAEKDPYWSFTDSHLFDFQVFDILRKRTRHRGVHPDPTTQPVPVSPIGQVHWPIQSRRLPASIELFLHPRDAMDGPQ